VTLDSAETLVSLEVLVYEDVFLSVVPFDETLVLVTTEEFDSVVLFMSEVSSIVVTFLNVVFPLVVTLGITQVPLTSLPILSGNGFFQEGFSFSVFGFGGRKKVLSFLS
jgi:hypothetical protein